jgi:hypothetical protein
MKETFIPQVYTLTEKLNEQVKAHDVAGKAITDKQLNDLKK